MTYRAELEIKRIGKYARIQQSLPSGTVTIDVHETEFDKVIAALRGCCQQCLNADASTCYGMRTRRAAGDDSGECGCRCHMAGV